MMISCREASRLMSEGLDRKLSLRERIALRVHTVMCALCRRAERQFRWLHEVGARALEAIEAALAAERLSSEARRRIMERLRRDR